MSVRSENWVFLGDSLTEGIGSSRISYVTELVNLLRQANIGAVEEVRLRQVDPTGFSKFVRYNLAGFHNADGSESGKRLWVWNFASEGRTIDSDANWLPFIENLRPQRVFLFRGSLESIIRPAALSDNQWPFWLPGSWKSYAAMDPRCYFSTTWWRQAKQVAINRMQQKVRLQMLKERSGIPLMSMDVFAEHFRALISQLQQVSEGVLVLGLLPVNEERFPDSPAQFHRINERVRDLTVMEGAEFFDWREAFQEQRKNRELFYLDGFHPNQMGAEVLGNLLFEHLAGTL